MTEENTMWMVRAGEGARLFEVFKKKNVVAVGWDRMGDLSKITDPEVIRQQIMQHWPEWTPPLVANQTAQLAKFRFSIKKKNLVLTYNPQERAYLVGEITSDYRYDKDMPEYHHVHDVKWLKSIPRDGLSVSTKNTLGAISTLFEIGEEAKAEILKLLAGEEMAPEGIEVQETELDSLVADMKGRAFEFIKDKISAMTSEQVPDLMAGILRSMGYQTIVSPPGPDMGKDIQASPDGLGLEEPRIKVEVKHRSGQMGASTIRSFIGGLRPGMKALFVSTGGFTKEAKYEAERANIPVTLIDLDMLVELVIRHYDTFDQEAKRLIPLIKIYWPE